MKTYTPEELAEIIEKHGKWLDDEEGGERANLSDANLIGANLRGANLIGANLSNANLSDANLRGANLIGANLSDANLSDANLSGANLSDANLSGANLIGANLSDANLSDANLRDANLIGANLRGANLRGANLSDIGILWGASGNCAEVKALQCDLWPVTYTSTHMQIGCQLHSLEKWWGFGEETIVCMEERALGWWKIWKPILRQIVEVSPAVPCSQAEPSSDGQAAV